jgi:hypothetical protein
LPAGLEALASAPVATALEPASFSDGMSQPDRNVSKKPGRPAFAGAGFAVSGLGSTGG